MVHSMKAFDLGKLGEAIDVGPYLPQKPVSGASIGPDPKDLSFGDVFRPAGAVRRKKPRPDRSEAAEDAAADFGASPD